MTHSQRDFLPPHIKYERDEERDQSLGCKSCVHHAYIWNVRVCQKHEGLTGNNMAICSDFRASMRSAHDKLTEAFKK